MMVTRMLLKRVAGSMLGVESAEPRVNGTEEGAGEAAGRLLAPGAGVGSPPGETAVESTALFRGPDEDIFGDAPKFSAWPELAVWVAFGEAKKQYHTTPARAQVSSNTGSHLFISNRSTHMNPRFELVKRPRLGKTVVRLPLSTPNQVARVAKY